MSTVIQIDNLSKLYRLGTIGSGTFQNDLIRWWAKIRKLDDPLQKVGERNIQNKTGNSDLIWALKDINLDVSKGDILGIIGKNGAGKSTLLKILSRITSPTTGSVKIKGRVASLLEIGTGFHPDLTGRENIYLNGAILGMLRNEIDQRLDEIIDFSGIERYIDTPVKRYSSGMYVRLAFAVGAHLNSDILIVDEVLAVGDIEFQKKCIGKMDNIAFQHGRTVLFVSHNMSTIQSLCSRACLIDQGQMLKVGSVKEIISIYYENTFQNESNSKLKTKNRSGNSTLQFVEYILLDNNSKSIYEVNCGAYIQIELLFEVFIDVIKDLRIGIAIKDQMHGNYVTELNSYYVSNDSYKVVNGKHKFTFDINKMPLSPGKYVIDLIATSGLEVLDYLKDAGQMIVTEGLFYNSGKMPLPGSYPIFFHDFTCKLVSKN